MTEPTAPSDRDEPTAGEPSTSTPSVSPVSTRRRRMAAVILAAIVLVTAVAAVIAESVARAQAQAVIAGEIREALQLERDHPITVAIEGGPVLLQLANGRFERIDVEVVDLSVGVLRGDLNLRVEGVPIDPQAETRSMHAEFAVAESDVAALADVLSGAAVADLRVEDGEIRFDTEFELFGVPFTVGLGVTPTVDDGQLVFTPSSVVVAGDRVDLAALQQMFGGLADSLVTGQTFCVAQYLPQALSLTAVQLADDQVVMTFDARNVALGGPEFATLGSCS